MYANSSYLGSTPTPCASLPANAYYSCHSRSRTDASTKQNLLEKFQYKTAVKLEAGSTKNIQQLTTHDLLTSSQQSSQYASLLARVEHIGPVDKLTGKVELRFSIGGSHKMILYSVLQEVPFFVYQHSCWSSVSPVCTRLLCGLHCRPLACGDIILALTEQPLASAKQVIQPDYTQQSPTKCLVERYMNEKIFAEDKTMIVNHKRRKLADEC